MLLRIHETCEGMGASLLVALAPDKEQVLFPVLGDRVGAEPLRRFSSFYRKDLPPPEAFRAETLAHLDDVAAVLARFCEERGVPFLSTTPALREALAAGRQVYFTWDAHWAPEGHRVAAETLAPVVSGMLRDLSEISGRRQTEPVIIARGERDADRPAAQLGDFVRRPIQTVNRAIGREGRVVDVPIVDAETVCAFQRRLGDLTRFCLGRAPRSIDRR